MAYCNLKSTEKIDKLNANPKISCMKYLKIPSNQPGKHMKLFAVRFLIYLPNHHQDMNKVSVICSELLHFEWYF